LSVQLISYTSTFFDIAYISFITAKGTRVFSPAALLWSFDVEMWGCLILSILVAFLVFKGLTIGMTLAGLDSAAEDANSYSHRGIVVQQKWGMTHQIFFIVNTYLDQDAIMPTFTPLRCFVALWLFFTLIITTLYRLVF
jgi:hypothetical protein